MSTYGSTVTFLSDKYTIQEVRELNLTATHCYADHVMYCYGQCYFLLILVSNDCTCGHAAVCDGEQNPKDKSQWLLSQC